MLFVNYCQQAIVPIQNQAVIRFAACLHHTTNSTAVLAMSRMAHLISNKHRATVAKVPAKLSRATMDNMANSNQFMLRPPNMNKQVYLYNPKCH